MKMKPGYIPSSSLMTDSAKIINVAAECQTATADDCCALQLFSFVNQLARHFSEPRGVFRLTQSALCASFRGLFLVK
jgi:hypothetical protein